MDLLSLLGLAMTAVIIAGSLLAYARLAAELADAEQQAYDRRFAEIVARYHD